MPNLYIDLETRSTVDLTKTGSWVYAKHESTDVLCLAYAIDDGLVQIILGDPCLTDKTTLPIAFLDALWDDDCFIWAHNAGFERHLWRHVLFGRYNLPPIDPARWRCTMALAGRWGLPLSLDNAGTALRLQVKKDKVGRALMLKMCKPLKSDSPDEIRWLEGPGDIKRLGEYCMTDIDVTREISKRLPPLEPEELALWQLTEQLNDYGVLTDQHLADSIMQVIGEFDERDLAQFQKLTEGAINTPNQVGLLRAWLAKEGVQLDDLRAGTVRDVLRGEGLSTEARLALRARQNLSKSSLAKFAALKLRADPDDHRVRGHLVYFAAHSGRWAGRGLQTQNLPSRAKLCKADEVALAPDVFNTRDAAYCEAMLTSPRTAASMSVRSCLVASPGKKLAIADFASVEARGLLWLADAPQLEIIKEGRNLYIEMANKIFGRDDLDKHANPGEYDLGKRAVLGLGYGLAGKTFQATCKKDDVVISRPLADVIVTTYRDWMTAVIDLWDLLTIMFHRALSTGESHGPHGMRMKYNGQALSFWLPSGKPLVYWYPGVEDTIAKDGTVWRDQIVYLHRGKKKTLYGGKLTGHAVQGMCRDLLRDAALRIDAARPEYKLVLMVHDELVYEVPAETAQEDFEWICQEMARVPDWAVGIPVAAEGGVSKRYKK